MKLFFRAIFSCACFFILASDAAAQSQRMAIPAGRIEVGRSETRIDAYCLDQHRSAPVGVMTSLLGPAASEATVTRLSDGAVLPLDVAMEGGWVAFGGLASAEGLTVVSRDGEEYIIDIPRPIAMSEQRGEFSADIAPTLEWMASLDKSEWISAARLWVHRASAAKKALGGDAAHAKDFGGLVSLWEIRLKVDQAGDGAITVAHVDKAADAFDRLVLAANQPIRVFSGADADRQILSTYRRDGAPLNIWLANPPALEQMIPIKAFLDAKIDKLRTAYINAAIDSDERALAKDLLEAYENTEEGIRFTAAKVGLLWADSDYLSGKDTLIVSEVPRIVASAAGGGGKFTGHAGILLAFNGGEPPNVGGGGSFGRLPERLGVFAGRAPWRAGQVEQGSTVWTAFASGWSFRLDSVFISAFNALTAAVFIDKPQEAVISSVREAVEYNRKAYADLAPMGFVDLDLLLDDDEVLRTRVAILNTPAGFRFAALPPPVEP